MATTFIITLVLLSMAGYSSATWCICKDGSDAALQKTLDYACGAGADCNPTHTNGPCYNPNNVRAHCNYAVNSYFQRQRQVATACDFSGTAVVTNSDPSTAGCSYPASATSTTPVSTTPGSRTPTVSGTTGNGGSPLVTSPSGVLGGVNNGLGPSGYNDVSFGVIPSLNGMVTCSFIIVAFSLLTFC